MTSHPDHQPLAKGDEGSDGPGQVSQERLREWMETTGMHGIPNIATRKILWKKIMWGIFVVLAIAFLTWQITKLFTTYYQYGTQVVISYDLQSVIDFPSVTFCDMNAVSTEKLKKEPAITKKLYTVLKKDKFFSDQVDDIVKSVGGPPTALTPIAINKTTPITTTPGSVTTTPGSITTTPSPNTTTIPPVTTTPGAATTTTSPVTTTTSPVTTTTGPVTTTTSLITTTTGPSKTIATRTTVVKTKIKKGKKDNHGRDIVEIVQGGGSPKKKRKGGKHKRKRRSVSETVETEGDQGPVKMSAIQREFVTQLSQLTGDEMMRIGASKKDFVYSCSYDGVHCSSADFHHFVSPTHGVCFTFNARGVARSRDSGFADGLSVVLVTNETDSLPSLTDTFGVKVLIHNPTRMPFPDRTGFVANPGHHNLVSMKLSKVFSIGGLHGRCRNYTESQNRRLNMYHSDLPRVAYSKQACFTTCLQTSIVVHCGCFNPYHMSKSMKTWPGLPRACNLTELDGRDKQCMDYQANENSTTYLKCNEKCRPDCLTYSYSPIISGGTWPSKTFYNTYMREELMKKPLFKRELEKFGGNGQKELEYVRKTFLKITLHFRSLNILTRTKTASYTWESLLSDIGGQIGLWMGFSVLTILEIFELFYDIFITTVEVASNRKK